MSDNDFANDPSLVPDMMGGYWLIALMDDGGSLCEKCLRDPTNPVHDEREHFGHRQMGDGSRGDGWGVMGFFTSGDTDEGLSCDHCGKVLVECDEEGT